MKKNKMMDQLRNFRPLLRQGLALLIAIMGSVTIISAMFEGPMTVDQYHQSVVLILFLILAELVNQGSRD